MKNYVKQITAMALVMTLGFVAGAANAYTYTDTTSLNANNDGFGDSYAFSPTNYTAGQSFDELYTFSIGAGGLSTAGNNGLNAGLAYNTTDVSVTSFSLLNSGSTALSTSTDNVNLSYTGNLAAGTYGLEIKGTALNSNGYSVGITVSPVPEPTEGALLLSGLGLLGFIAARRNRNEA